MSTIELKDPPEKNEQDLRELAQSDLELAPLYKLLYEREFGPLPEEGS